MMIPELATGMRWK